MSLEARPIASRTAETPRASFKVRRSCCGLGAASNKRLGRPRLSFVLSLPTTVAHPEGPPQPKKPEPLLRSGADKARFSAPPAAILWRRHGEGLVNAEKGPV